MCLIWFLLLLFTFINNKFKAKFIRINLIPLSKTTKLTAINRFDLAKVVKESFEVEPFHRIVDLPNFAS